MLEALFLEWQQGLQAPLASPAIGAVPATAMSRFPFATLHSRGLQATALALLLSLAGQLIAGAPASAGMLDLVKQNPEMARKLCDQFKQLNASGQSATSKEAIARLAASQGLSAIDAEVLTTYVIGLHCPDVR